MCDGESTYTGKDNQNRVGAYAGTTPNSPSRATHAIARRMIHSARCGVGSLARDCRHARARARARVITREIAARRTRSDTEIPHCNAESCVFRKSLGNLYVSQPLARAYVL